MVDTNTEQIAAIKKRVDDFIEANKMRTVIIAVHSMIDKHDFVSLGEFKSQACARLHFKFLLHDREMQRFYEKKTFTLTDPFFTDGKPVPIELPFCANPRRFLAFLAFPDLWISFFSDFFAEAVNRNEINREEEASFKKQLLEVVKIERHRVGTLNIRALLDSGGLLN